MKLKEEHIDLIKTKFKAMETKQDLVDLINTANQLLYGKDYKPLFVRGFSFYANPKFCKDRYRSFEIPKKSGRARMIHAPVYGLNHILKPLNFILNIISEPHFKAMGFVPGKSIVDNAKPHVGRHYVYNTDLKDFFHSFDLRWVKYGFMMPPFGLGKEREDLAFLLASLCTHPFEIEGEIKTVLPQGAPTSPTITNILCVKLDRRLNGLAKRFKVEYTRYADDITFSSQTNVFRKEEFQNELRRIIEDQKLEINQSKTRTQSKGFRQEVTGLTVNDKVNVSSRYLKQLRMWLYYWERYGYRRAYQLFESNYKKDKGYIKKGRPGFADVVLGKLTFLKMVKGEDDSTYKKLNNRFEKLSSVFTLEEELLTIWEDQGIDDAIAFYIARGGVEIENTLELGDGLAEYYL